MAVLFVVGHIQFESRCLCSTLRLHTLGRRFLLRQDGLQFQSSELHIGAHTKQTAGTLYQRVVRWERHISRLYQLDDFILLAFVLQLQVLCIKVEGSIGVVVQVHVHLVAHPSVQVQVHLLIKVEGCSLTVADRQRGVIGLLDVTSNLQFSRSLSFDAHAARTENLLGRSQVEVHIGKVELIFAGVLGVLGVLLVEEVVQGSFLHPSAILLGSHQYGSIQIRVAQLCADVVHVQRVVILHGLAYVGRCLQVDGRAVQVVHKHRSRLLNAITCLQRVLLLCPRAHAREPHSHYNPNNSPHNSLFGTDYTDYTDFLSPR